MGLDMYLNATRYLYSIDSEDAGMKRAIFELFPELVDLSRLSTAHLNHLSVKEVKLEIGYWRKANAIHNWFVKNVQVGKDDCDSYYVKKHQLLALKDVCQQVLADNSLAPDLLPTVSGFFFGTLEYDEDYVADLLATIEIIDNAVALPDSWEVEYRSSW